VINRFHGGDHNSNDPKKDETINDYKDETMYE